MKGKEYIEGLVTVEVEICAWVGPWVSVGEWVCVCFVGDWNTGKG